MRFFIFCISFILFSNGAIAQSEKEKDKFMKQLFDDFKTNRLDKIAAQFVDSAFLDEIIVESKKREGAVTKRFDYEEIHHQRKIVAERLAESFAKAYQVFTKNKNEDKFRKIKPQIEVFSNSQEPFKTFTVKYNFLIDDQEGELSISNFVYHEKRKRFVIMAEGVRYSLLPSEMTEITSKKEYDKKSDELYSVEEEIVDSVPDFPPPPMSAEHIRAKARSKQLSPAEDTAPSPVNESAVKGSDEVFQFVEQMPEFPGGNDSMMRFIAKNIHYPEIARESNVQGRVYARFVVSKDGSIRDIEIIRGIGYGCDEEAIRVINKMPKWKPGMQRGKAVPVSFTLPFSFKLK